MFRLICFIWVLDYLSESWYDLLFQWFILDVQTKVNLFSFLFDIACWYFHCLIFVLNLSVLVYSVYWFLRIITVVWNTQKYDVIVINTKSNDRLGTFTIQIFYFGYLKIVFIDHSFVSSSPQKSFSITKDMQSVSRLHFIQSINR